MERISVFNLPAKRLTIAFICLHGFTVILMTSCLLTRRWVSLEDEYNSFEGSQFRIEDSFDSIEDISYAEFADMFCGYYEDGDDLDEFTRNAYKAVCDLASALDISAYYALAYELGAILSVLLTIAFLCINYRTAQALWVPFITVAFAEVLQLAGLVT